MSEDASGGEVRFVRIFFPANGFYVERWGKIKSGVHATLTREKNFAEVFVSPSAELLADLGKIGPLEQREATYAEWIESGEPKTRP